MPLTDKNRRHYYKKMYCNYKCLSERNGKITKKCNHCGTLFKVNYGHRKRKYCSQNCSRKEVWKISNKINKTNGKGIYGISKKDRANNIKKAQETLKKLKKGFYSSKFQSEMGLRNSVERRKARVRGAHKTNKICKELKLGYYNHDVQSKGGIAGQKTLRRLGISSFYDYKIQREIRLNMEKNKKRYYFKGIYFDSFSEMEFAMNIYYQIEKLILWKNYQIVINSKLIDFLVEKYKCFIEFHKWDRKNGTDIKKYYKIRRKILDDSNYKDYNLICIN